MEETHGREECHAENSEGRGVNAKVEVDRMISFMKDMDVGAM